MAYDTPFGRTLDGKEISYKKAMKDGWSSAVRQGKGFGAVGAAYSVSECIIESVSTHSVLSVMSLCGPIQSNLLHTTQYRGKHDIQSAVGGGFTAGAILARKNGTRAMLWAGLSFAGFSYALEKLWIRKPPADEDSGFFVC